MTQQYTNLSNGRRRRKYVGEVVFYYKHKIWRSHVGAIRGEQSFEGYAERKVADIPGERFRWPLADELGQARTRKECEELAWQQGKRAVFRVRRGVAGYAIEPKRKPEPPKSELELAEAALRPEALEWLHEVWTFIEAERKPFRAVQYLEAVRLLTEEAALACREKFEASKERDTERSANASKRCRNIGAGLAWLELKAKS